MDERRERLKALLKQRAVKFGEFVLKGGTRTDVYVDGRLFTLSSEGAVLAAELLWEKMAPLRPDAVGGMTLGADPIVGALLHFAGTQKIPLAGFLVRKEAKGYGMKKSVEGPRPDRPRPRVVLVEDTFTTGTSTLDAARRVREEWRAHVVAAFAVVDREAGATDAFAREGITCGALVTLAELRG